MDITIIKSTKGGKKARLLFLPNNVLNNCLIKHAKWKGLSYGNVGFIRDKPSLILKREKPSSQDIIKIIIFTLKFSKVSYEGPNSYPIDHTVFSNIKVAQMNEYGEPISDLTEGELCTFIENLKENQLNKYLKKRYNLSDKSIEKIKNTKNKLVKEGVERIAYFIITHLHPIKKGSRCN